MWLAAHLFYDKPQDVFLANALKPFVNKLVNDELIYRYYFIRFQDRGPHIMLRLKGDVDILKNKVKPELIIYFADYFKTNPSQRNEPDWVNALPAEQQWFPNNSIQFIEIKNGGYVIEPFRYGGKGGIILAEKQFHASSDSIFSIIAESEDWNADLALGYAIQLHLGFAYALNMDINEAVHFFNLVFQQWTQNFLYYFSLYHKNQDEVEQKIEEALNAFVSNFKQQKERLTSFTDDFWSILQESEEAKVAWLKKWIENMTSFRQEFELCHKAKQLTLPSNYKFDHTIDFPSENQERWSIYKDFYHPTNNRLGILHKDEWYLSYLIKENLTYLKALSN